MYPVARRSDAGSFPRPAPREGECGPLVLHRAGGVRLFAGGIGGLLALIVVRSVGLGVIAIGRRPAGAAAGGKGLGGKRGKAGQTPDAPERPAGLARGERQGRAFAEHRRKDRGRLGIEHVHRDRIRKAPSPGIDLADPVRSAQPDEPIGNHFESGDGRVRSLRTKAALRLDNDCLRPLHTGIPLRCGDGRARPLRAGTPL